MTTRLQVGVVFVLSAAALVAQLTRGFISGTVQDATGAVMVNVRIAITNKATNQQRETTSNALGVYRLAGVEPGVYAVEFTSQGFETRRADNVTVGTTQEVVLNQVLSVSQTTATVEVNASALSVDLSKSTATMDRKLDQRFIENVPLTGATRDVTRLALMAPTVTRAPGSTEFAANGQRARNNNFLIDGVDNNDLSVTLTNNRIIPEAVAEFQVQTAAYSAEFGRNSGAQVSIITRSGTNNFHGEVFDYYRANWMEPVSLLNKRANVKETPRFVHNQAGGDIGGPILRDRMFFFGLIETNRRREAPDARNASSFTIPTPTGYAALSRLPLGEGQTAASRQAVLDAMNFLPDVHGQVSSYQNVADVSVNGVPVQVGTGRIPLANPYNFWFEQHRIDYRLTDRDSITYRTQLDKREQPDVISNLQFGNRFSGAQTIYGQNHTISHTRNITPRFINEFRSAYTRRNLDFPENDTRPTITISSNFTIGGLTNFPQGRVSNLFQWQDAATYLAGRHSLKFGTDLRRNRLFNRSGFDSKGSWLFNSLSDFLNNRAFSLNQAVNESTFDARQTDQNYFFQDDIKVSKDLTLNLGMRYEYSGVPFGFFGAANAQVAAAGVPLPTRPDKNNWAPRAGLAWSPSPKDGLLHKLLGDGQTVFRGGYGMAYDVLFYNILTVNASNYPRVVTQLTNQPDTINLFPRLAPKQATAPPFNPLASFVNSPLDLQRPTTHFYNFTIQRQFKDFNIFEIGYTGARSYHQIRQGQTNPGLLTRQQADLVVAGRNPNAIPGLQARRLNPLWGPRTTIESTALGNYNAMFVRYDRKFSRGLVLGANYTWSANLSDNDESLGVGAITDSSSQVPQDYFNYKLDWARSVFDRPHRFVAHYSYEIRLARAANPFVKHVLGGWMVTGFSEWQSGQPFTIRTGVDSGGSGTTGPFRPNYNPGGAFQPDPDFGNLRTFTIPINGTGIVVSPLTTGGLPLQNGMFGGGNLGKNTFRGQYLTLWNLSLQKIIPLHESWKLQLRSDWINMWNHRNFGNPNAVMNSPAFGTNTTDPGGRTMLVSAKIRF